MNIILTEVIQSAAQSRETPAFTANLHIDGLPRGSVRNDGGGGCCFWTDRTAERELDAYAKTLPPVEFDGFKVPESAETLVFGLLPDQFTEQGGAQ